MGNKEKMNIVLSEEEKDEVRRALDSYSKTIPDKCEYDDSETDDTAEDGTRWIRAEDHQNIYKAVQSGDSALFRLAVNVIVVTTTRLFRKRCADCYGAKSYYEKKQDIDDALQNFYGYEVPRILVKYNPSRANVVTFLKQYDRASFLKSRYGELTKYQVDAYSRTNKAIAELKRKGVENPTPENIRQYEVDSGRSQPLSTKKIKEILGGASAPLSKSSADAMREVGREQEAPRQYDPEHNFFENEEISILDQALARMPERYRMVVEAALFYVDLSSPKQESQEFYNYLRINVLRDPNAPEEALKSLASTALEVFREAEKAVLGSGSSGRRRRSSLSLSLDPNDDIYRQEEQDLLASFGEEFTSTTHRLNADAF